MNVPSPATQHKLSADARARWSCEKILRAVEQVYPIETPDPPGFNPAFKLRPYQRQSLAFMLQLEKSNDHSLRGFPQAADGRGKAFHQVSRSTSHSVRGGWLCDEMGMGKTAVCAALVLANPHRSDDKVGKLNNRRCTIVLVNNSLVGQWVDEMHQFAPNLKIVKYYGSSKHVLTQAYLDSIDILITTPHTSGVDRKSAKEHGVPTLHCRRLILDESHLYEPKASPKLPSTKVFDMYRPKKLWCVTGTPCSTSLGQLETQARMLGQWASGLKLGHLLVDPPKYDPPEKGTRGYSNEAAVELLQKVMIRHSKAQRIQGAAALALPDSACATTWLDFSREERVLYSMHGCADGVPKWADENRHSELTLADVSKGLSKRRGAVAGVYTETAVTGADREHHYTLGKPGAGQLRPAACAAYRKLVTTDLVERKARSTKYTALFDDLAALRAASKGAPTSVVIFTHYNEVLAELCEILRATSNSGRPGSALEVHEVSRQTPPERRHTALRNFQSSESRGKSAVFATTFATAAVGLTLTAASRVYLLESSIDPAQEAQAAGRIHRLGQTKEVLVKRLFFTGSIDEAVHALHAQIKGGSLSLEGGKFPAKALDTFREHGVAQPHKRLPNAPMLEAKRRYRSDDKDNVHKYGGDGGFDYGKIVQTQPCECCNKGVEVPGTSEWWGKGKWKKLLDGCTDDFPQCLQGQEHTDE